MMFFEDYERPLNIDDDDEDESDDDENKDNDKENDIDEKLKKVPYIL